MNGMGTKYCTAYEVEMDSTIMILVHWHNLSMQEKQTKMKWNPIKSGSKSDQLIDLWMIDG